MLLYLVCSHFVRQYPAEIDTETILKHFCSPLHFFPPLTINIRERFESQRFWVPTHLEKRFPYSRKAVHRALYYSAKFKSNHFFEKLINKQRGTRPWYVNRAYTGANLPFELSESMPQHTKGAAHAIHESENNRSGNVHKFSQNCLHTSNDDD